jgi:hypothetical protein
VIVQNTRLSNLFDAIARQLSGWLQNPWRRWSLLAIAILVGFFLASAIATTAGQAAVWDLPIAAFLTVLSEGVSRWVYGRGAEPGDRSPPLLYPLVNLLKIGVVFGLFLEAFKLGS